MSLSTMAKLGLAAALLGAGVTAQATIYVDPTGSNGNTGENPTDVPVGTGPVRTINYANLLVDAGGDIELLPGTYGDEQGIIQLGTKDVTLNGNGETLNAHTTLTVARDGGLIAPYGSPSPTTYRPVIFCEGHHEVRIRDLTLDGNNNVPASGRLHGLYVVSGADVDMLDCEIINCGTGGGQSTAAVVIRGDAGPTFTCDVELRNTKIMDFGKAGVVALFNSKLTMLECHVDGNGHNDFIAQNGVQVSFGAECDLRRNTVTDMFYDVPPPAINLSAAGIIGFEAGLMDVKDNNIGNCEAAITLFSASPTSFAGEISDNETVASNFAITMDNVSGYSIVRNICHVVSEQFDAVFDNTVGGNDWEGNSYSDFVANPYTINPGITTDTDTTATSALDIFDGVITTMLGKTPVDMALGEFDGFAPQDVVVVNTDNTITVLAGQGDGTFQVYRNISAFASASVADPVKILVGDFGGGLAGKDDFVVLANADPGNGPTVPNQVKAYTYRVDGSSGSINFGTTELNFNLVTPGANIISDAATGLLNDTDTLNDLVVTDSAENVIRILLNDGTGEFAIPPVDGVGFIGIGPGGFNAGGGSFRAVALGEITGDGIQDMVIVFGDATAGLVSGYIVSPGYIPAAGSYGFDFPMGVVGLFASPDPQGVVIDDVNDDGFLDFLVATGVQFPGAPGTVQYFENDGSTSFEQTQLLVDTGPVAIAAGADVDLDGFRDVAIASPLSGNTTMLARFDCTGFSAGGYVDYDGSSIALSFGEFTSDTRPDLLLLDASLMQIRVLRGANGAIADNYGFGCPGTGGLVPNLRPIGVPPLPLLGNAGFGVQLSDGLPFAASLFAAGPFQAPGPWVPCQLLLDFPITDTWFRITDGMGRASVALPIPSNLALVGAELFMQAGVIDPGNTTAFVPGFSLTEGLRLRVGN